MSNKSEATWHPNSGPVTDHADLIAQARRRADVTASIVEATLLRDLADTLISEREATNQIVREETALLRHKYRGAMSVKGRSQRERDEARAERDALAHVLRRAEHSRACPVMESAVTVTNGCTCWKSTVPSAALARHDAEVMCPHWAPGSITLRPACTSCAAAIRAEAE